MRVSTRGLLVAGLGGVLAATPLLAVQQSMLLRYQPRVGRIVRTVAWTDVAMTIGDLPVGEAAPPGDTLRLDVELLQGVTERVLERRGTAYVVQRTLDSVRTRMRAMGGAWRDVEGDSAVRPVARLLLTERLQIEDFTLTAGDTTAPAVEWLRNPAGTFELSFPEEPVTVGQSWTTDLVFPLTTAVEFAEIGTDVAEGAELVAQVTATLDSVVPRTTDTLAYVRVAGSFLPLTVSEAAEIAVGIMTIRGAFASTLIWSSGWAAWVSGAARARVTMRMESAATDVAGEPVPGGFELRMDMRSRFQVRP